MMDTNSQRLFPSEMGVRDSGSSLDILQFQDLEKVIDFLFDDYSKLDNDTYESVPLANSSTSYLAKLVEDKSKYFLQVSSNIIDTKNNFMRLYDSINGNIEDTMRQIMLRVESRQEELKKELRSIAANKIAKWDRQLSICREALLHLQRGESYFSNGRTNSQLDYFLNCESMKELEFIDAGDIKFEAKNYRSIFKCLKNVGNIVHYNEVVWSLSCQNAFKSIAPKFLFGESGDGASQFCRPWGVCSDTSGRILICDRSNHRIQVFNECGDFIFYFGKEGSNPGEFNRPTGIDIDKKRRIIVADKDNHRIQVFDYYGRYQFSFGSRGTQPGQFMYPWDVSTNARCYIAVSDSKNHRVQLFNNKGGFIAVFDPLRSGLRYGLKVLDSPRGVAFRPDGCLLVTDLNNHCILILNETFDRYYSIGSEGLLPGQFFRPQGIACDKNGQIAVADSKNFRIQIFDHDLRFLKSFGSQGEEPGQFDCPQGICFHPNKNIIVVDFNNNRVQVF